MRVCAQVCKYVHSFNQMRRGACVVVCFSVLRGREKCRVFLHVCEYVHYTDLYDKLCEYVHYTHRTHTHTNTSHTHTHKHIHTHLFYTSHRGLFSEGMRVYRYTGLFCRACRGLLAQGMRVYRYTGLFYTSYHGLFPPDPMNHVKILKGQPRRFALWELVPNWYKVFPRDHIDQVEINN